jgi:gp47
MPGGSGENKHPGTNRTPPQTNKKAPRIDQQGKGKVFIPPTPFRPLERQ